ncbi:MAG: hypothetical protein J6B01_07340 [Ruminococcus sp.]|nr:hypothetical protein [Ruminococcus sp.]
MILELSEIFNNVMADIGELLPFGLFLGGALGTVVGLIYVIIRNIKEIKELNEDEKNDSNEE